MKRLCIIFLLLPMVLCAQNKVAVYVTSSDSKVDDAMKQIVGGELVAAIVKTNRYRAVERTADFLHQISTEQGYQHSGNVDDQQISALGKQFGVEYVCVASIMPYKDTYYLQARMIDVETVTVLGIAREVSPLSNIDEIVKAAGKVAQKLIGDEEVVTNRSSAAVTTPRENKSLYFEEDPEYIKVKKMRDAGAILTSCGVIPIGVPLLAIGQKEMKFIETQGADVYSDDNFVKAKKMRDAGAVLTGCGIIPIGAPLLAIGQSHMKKIVKKNAKQK